jgi:hypothetical protein
MSLCVCARIQYYVDQMYDVRYPGMDPIMCIVVTDTGVVLFCLVEVENSFFLPTFNQFGNSWEYPQICNW